MHAIAYCTAQDSTIAVALLGIVILLILDNIFCLYAAESSGRHTAKDSAPKSASSPSQRRTGWSS